MNFIWKMTVLLTLICSTMAWSAEAKKYKKVEQADREGKEELIIVQTVSVDGRSFVVTKGLKEGIFKGMEVTFSNGNSSMVCKAVEVNRTYSLWKPVDPNAILPFRREDIISYNSHAYGNVSLDVVADYKNITPQINFDEVYKKFRTLDSLSAKLGLNNAFSYSTTSADSKNNSGGLGYSLAFEYNKRWYPEIELSVGLRYDTQTYLLKNPELDIPNNRVMAIASINYHLTAFTTNANNFYVGLSAGIGQSTTTINQTKSKGLVTLLPEARLGFLKPLNSELATLFEASIESISSNEKFDDNSVQTTNLINFKATFGLKF